MLTEMQDKGESFFQFAQRMSKQHQHTFMQQEHSGQDQLLLQQEATDSWRRQRELEASDKVSFDQFLEDYFSQQLDEEAIQTVEKRSISAN
jgi:glutamate--cysteine ligase